jgi:hypothetical protein
MGQRIIILAIMLGLGLTAQAHASCVCRCVDGKMRALCSNAIDIAPACPITVCGIPPAAIKPIERTHLPPLGTFHCDRQQVLNPTTQQYEWRRICQ